MQIGLGKRVWNRCNGSSVWSARGEVEGTAGLRNVTADTCWDHGGSGPGDKSELECGTWDKRKSYEWYDRRRGNGDLYELCVPVYVCMYTAAM